MSGALTITAAGPAMSVQDLGRRGFRAQGLTVGGAADRTAMFEGAALLGQSADRAAIEMASSGGTFQTDLNVRIALTGADMGAKIDGEPRAWNASHLLPKGATLTIGGARNGTYGYLHIGGGVVPPVVMGARSSHLAGGIGDFLATGNILPIGSDQSAETGKTLTPINRFGGGTLRVVRSMQTSAFPLDTLERFQATQFNRDARANRMGVRMDFIGEGFATQDQLNILSEVVVPGDVQIAGDGAPFVLMYECQTTGGYPRIGTVLPCDLPKVSQAQTAAPFRFEFVDLETAIDAQKRYAAELRALPGRLAQLIRDPADIRDLLGYQLVSGTVSALADPFETGDNI